MPSRLSLEARRVSDRLEHGEPFWPAQLALGLAAALGFLASDRVTVGPKWIVSAVELAAIVVLAFTGPGRATHHRPTHRRLALSVFSVVALTNLVSLGLLVHYLVAGGKAGGEQLLISGVVLWVTNVLLFAVLYWEMDRGGPVERFQNERAMPDLLFPQMDSPEHAPAGWRPGFVDYLYTSLTAATAFSPTDTMPLTHTAKIVMAVQSTTALMTIGLVVARAVNILS